MTFWQRDTELRKRAEQIAAILIRHGFGILIRDLGLHHLLAWRNRLNHVREMPKENRSEEFRLMAHRLPGMLEELGPAFIKLGQFLSSRSDVLPKYVTDALSKLQEKVTPVEFETMRGILADNYPDYQELFSYIDPVPLGSASIAQTHLAHRTNGKKVVIKICKPEVMNLIDLDIRLLKKLMVYLARQSSVRKLMDVESTFAVFFHSLEKETDFTLEAENIEFFRSILEESGTARTPLVEWDITNENILTMEYIEGLEIEAVAHLDEETRKNLAWKFLESFLSQVFLYGVFHGDPHSGNVRLTREGEIIYLDFGIVGRVDVYTAELMIQNLLALKNMDVSAAMNVALEMGRPIGPVNWQTFYEDMAEQMVSAQRLAQGKVEAGKLIRGMMNIAMRNNIRMPDRLILVGKALALTEGNARKIYPEINLLEVAEPVIRKFIGRHLQPSLDEASIMANLFQLRKKWNVVYNELPSFVSGLTKGEKKIPLDISGFEFIGDKLDRSVNRISYSLILASMMLAAAIMMQTPGGGTLTESIHYTGYYLLLGALGAALVLFFMIFRQVKK